MKRFISIITVLFFVVGILTACDSKSVKPPIMAEYCIGKDYELVETSFANAGFTNISKTALEDLELTDSSKAGTIKQISIDGKINYSTRDTFTSTSIVIIEYHSIKSINAPISANDAKSEDIVVVHSTI